MKINLEFRPANELVVGINAGGYRSGSNITTVTNINIVNAALWVDYVYLDTEERRRFAQMSHEYLIDQLQVSSSSVQKGEFAGGQKKITLDFNHPVKELIWVIQREANYTVGTLYNDWFNYSAAAPGTPVPSDAVDLMADAVIVLNGHERFAPRPQTYFRLVQPYQHHTRIPEKHIYLYSFGIRPEEHQPSGTVNMSRIDNATLRMDFTPAANYPGVDTEWVETSAGRILLFAPNYNVFRVMSGMGGLDGGQKSSLQRLCEYIVDKTVRISPVFDNYDEIIKIDSAASILVY